MKLWEMLEFVAVAVLYGIAVAVNVEAVMLILEYLDWI